MSHLGPLLSNKSENVPVGVRASKQSGKSHLTTVLITARGKKIKTLSIFLVKLRNSIRLY
jgi:hypothetical protein